MTVLPDRREKDRVKWRDGGARRAGLFTLERMELAQEAGMWSDGEKGLEEEGPPRNEEITDATGKRTIAVNADQGE